MRKILFVIATMVCTFCVSADVVRYGYAPEIFDETEMIAQGSGTNGFCAGMICLDPAVDPAVKRLEGHSVKGVRCYFINDYKQSRQNRSMIMCSVGTPDAEPITKICDFVAGWNEIYFDSPITIGADPIYLGLQVYELRGTPYPLVTYGSADISGGCWVNLEKEGWTEYKERGTLMIQAILDDEAASKIDNMVYASVEDSPMVIAPAEFFDAKVFVHNMSGEEISSITLNTIGQGDTEAHVQEVTFETPLAYNEGRMIELPVRAGYEEGAAQWLSLTVSKYDGVDVQQTREGLSTHNVSVDAFERIPLIEEFTSQVCTNCPFMIYYLDMAMEMYDGPLAYVTHHSGFQKDRFTKPMDEDILYLFGSKALMNPAVMYDRWVPSGESSPIFGAQVAEYTPYLEQIQAAALRPAMASVNIDLNYSKGDRTVGCTISGRVGSGLVSGGIPAYLSVYLVEDGIEVTEEYFQLGLDDEGAPADIKEKFRHNGVKRHVFNVDGVGDMLTVDNEGNYTVTFDPITMDESWDVENCKILAYVSKVNKDDITDNGVLNANYKHLVETNIVSIDKDPVQSYFRVTPDRKIESVKGVNDFAIYSLQGLAVDKGDSLQPGVYVVKYKTNNGVNGAKKLIVK